VSEPGPQTVGARDVSRNGTRPRPLRVIVLHCFSRIGLAVLNGLDREYELIGGMLDRPGLWGFPYERYLRSGRLHDVFRYPAPEKDLAGFQEALLDACRRYDADAVFPTSTGLAIALSQMKGSLPPDLETAFVIEDWEKLSWFADKWRTYELATELGIPTPRTILPVGGSMEGVKDLGLPIVAKPRLGEAAHGIQVFHDLESVARFIENPPHIGVGSGDEYPYILQEYVPGEIHDGGTCAAAGRPTSLYSQHRTVTIFEFGGPSLVVQLTEEPEIREYAARLLARLQWNGVIVFEFIKRPDGTYAFLEGNPRVGAAVQCVIEGGMNVCQQAVEIIALGRDPVPTLDYPVGMACKWYCPTAVKMCFREPRTRESVLTRARGMFGRYRPGPTVTNLRLGSMRHLAGIVVDGMAMKYGRPKAAVSAAPAPPAGDATPAPEQVALTRAER
jgi:predicted ATP-grasp superfamily ATP-dependent carboligase